MPGGLMVSEGGYTLALTGLRRAGGPRPAGLLRRSKARTARSRRTTWSTRSELHFIAVRRDFTGFQHVHPRALPRTAPGRTDARPDRRDSGGSSPTSSPPAARPLTLGADLVGPGADGFAAAGSRPRARPTVDGYTVTLDRRPGRRRALDAEAARRPRTAGRSPTCSPTSAPTATSSRCAVATSPTCTSTPTASPATGRPSLGRRSRSAPRCPAPGPTTSTSTSSTTASCARPSSARSAGDSGPADQ